MSQITPVLETPVVNCGECGAPMKLVRSKHLTDDGQPRYFYGCTKFPECRGTHGSDAWGRPLGIPANRETNEARHAARLDFDSFWRGEKWKRNGAYIWLAKRLKIDRKQCSFASFDLETCKRVTQLLKEARQRRGIHYE